MGPWATGHATIGSTARAGRILRRLGFEVSARGDQPWTMTPRDRLELAAFRRDHDRVRRSVFGADAPPAGSGAGLELADLDAIAWADRNAARWTLGAAHPIACCLGCHFDFEEAEIWPYLPSTVRMGLQVDHDRLRRSKDRDAIEVHARAERRAMLSAGVPARLVRAMDQDHERIRRADL